MLENKEKLLNDLIKNYNYSQGIVVFKNSLLLLENEKWNNLINADSKWNVINEFKYSNTIELKLLLNLLYAAIQSTNLDTTTKKISCNNDNNYYSIYDGNDNEIMFLLSADNKSDKKLSNIMNNYLVSNKKRLLKSNN